jgi:cytochrome c-type biogenesis protein CcmE
MLGEHLGMGACRRLRERAFMLAIVVIVVVLAVSGLALYAIRNKVGFKVSATAVKWFSFSIEVESQDGRKGGELPSVEDNQD